MNPRNFGSVPEDPPIVIVNSIAILGCLFFLGVDLSLVCVVSLLESKYQSYFPFDGILSTFTEWQIFLAALLASCTSGFSFFILIWLPSWLPGIISLSSKFIPTIMNLVRRLAEEGQNPATNNPQRNPSKSNHNAVTASSAMSSSASFNVTSLDNGTEYTSPSKYE